MSTFRKIYTKFWKDGKVIEELTPEDKFFFVYLLTNPATTHILPPCFIYELTGFQCAGCGATRAVHQILNLNFKEAFILNPLIFIYAVLVMYFLIKLVILKLQKKDIKAILKKEITIILYILLVLTVVFMTLRNIINWII